MQPLTVQGLDEGQVLQRLGARGARVDLTGTTPEAGPVLATIFNGARSLKGWKEKKVGQARSGKFTARLENIPIGGPYRLELKVAKKSMVGVNSFFVGDVWLLAGQSNMEGVGNIAGAAKAHPLIRSFSMAREWQLAREPLHLMGESPDQCHFGPRQLTREEADKHRRTTLKGTGPGLFFAQAMLKRMGVPQGLLCVAHGGTSMTQWNPALKKLGGKSMYGSALLSLRATGQPVAGVLWYQGESDANKTDAPHYTKRMKALVAAFRRDLHAPRLPWVIVQIARVIGLRPAADSAAWNSIQEQERLLPGKIPARETVSAIDLALDDGIHISAQDYPRLAARMARAAARLVHGDRTERRPPQLRGISTSRDPVNIGDWLIDVHFDHVVGGLKAAGKPNGFAVVDAEGRDLNAIFKTTLHRSTVRLHVSLPLLEGLSVHHGFGTSPYCNITDGRDEALPVLGPLPLPGLQGKAIAVLPFVTAWHATGVIAHPPPLAEIDVPEGEVDQAPVKTGAIDGFFNQHDLWTGQSGHAYFAAKMTLSEPMRLDFRMAYDGPFRLWLNRQPFFTDLNGTNPCVPDKAMKTISIPAGEHDLRIGMDISNGYAWGFRLRFERKDLTQAEIKAGHYAKPIYST